MAAVRDYSMLNERFEYQKNRIKHYWSLRHKELPYDGPVKFLLQDALKCAKEYRDRLKQQNRTDILWDLGSYQ